MLPRLLAWLNDLPIADPVRRYQATMLQNILLALLAANLLITAFVGVPWGLAPSQTGPMIGALLTAAFVGGLLLLRSGRLSAAVNLTIGISLAGATQIVASRGLTAHGSVTIAFVLPITMAGLLLQRRSRLMVTGLCIGLVALVFVVSGPSRGGAEALVGFILVGGLLTLLLDRYRSGWEFSVSLARANELRLQLVLDLTPIAVAMSDPDLLVTYWNPAAARLFGWNATEVVGRPLTEVLFNQSVEHPSIEALRTRLRTQRATTSGQSEYRTREGRAIICEWYNTPLYDLEGAYIGTLGMVQDVTDRHRREAAIHELNLELEQRVAERTAELAAKNRELEVFAYSVSHDLKAPLRGLDGYSRLLIEDYADRLEGDGAHYLAMIRQATANMSELIDDLLAYSRVERRALRISAIALRPVVDLLVGEHADALAAARAELVVDLPDLEVWAEEEGLAQALRNLIENALKFSRAAPAPRILVGGERRGDTCLIWVRDNGIGFSMEYHDRIFELFQRLHRAEEYPGTGIGLAIVRKAVERMGGAIWAESAPGAGATFFVSLPLAPRETL